MKHPYTQPTLRLKGKLFRRGLVWEFFAQRLSVVGLARKYGLTVKEVEGRIRKAL